MLVSRLFAALELLTAQQTTARTCFSLVRDSFKMSSASDVIEQKIQGKKVMVFSKSYCPYCTKAKQVFNKLLKDGVLTTDDYEVMEIENDPNCNQIQDALGKKTGARSVPRVFINQKFYGGGDDVVSGDKNGSLVKAITS